MTLAAVPIAVHMLRMRRSKRVAFPSVRFVRPSQTASVRLRAPSDLRLLALRVTIVALAGLACAQPLWITPAREAAWNARIARAIVVDASESMRDSVAADAVREGVARESGVCLSHVRVGRHRRRHHAGRGVARARAAGTTRDRCHLGLSVGQHGRRGCRRRSCVGRVAVRARHAANRRHQFSRASSGGSRVSDPDIRDQRYGARNGS